MVCAAFPSPKNDGSLSSGRARLNLDSHKLNIDSHNWSKSIVHGPGIEPRPSAFVWEFTILVPSGGCQYGQVKGYVLRDSSRAAQGEMILN